MSGLVNRRIERDPAGMRFSRVWKKEEGVAVSRFAVLPGQNTSSDQRCDVVRACARLSRRLIPSVALLVISCTSSQVDGARDVITDSANTTIVTNRGSLWRDDEAWAVMPQALTTIGVLDGDDAYEFHDIPDAAVQSDGDVVVVDAGTGTVRLFNAEGVLIRTLGSAGSAPGEFRRPSGVAINSADSVFVWDAAAWWLTKFGPDGEFAAVQTMSPSRMEELSSPPYYPESAVPLQDGTLLVRLGAKATGKSGSSKEGPTPSSRTDSFRRPAAALRATVAAGMTELIDTFPGEEQVVVASPWGEIQVAPALAKSTAIATQPNGTRICLGDQETPEIRCFGDGGSRMVIRWPAVPAAVDPDGARVTSWREAATETYRQKLDRDGARRLIEQIPIPAYLPPYTSVHIDKTGHIWVDAGPNDPSDTSSSDFSVFAPDGILLGSVTVPRGRILEIGDDYILAVREDDFGVQYLDRYRLVKPAS